MNRLFCNNIVRRGFRLVATVGLALLGGLAGAMVPLNGLIGYWPGHGSAADDSPTHNNGSFGGSYVPGGPGGSAFNLATGLVVISNNSAYNFTSYAGWTVGFWFNTNNIPVGGNGYTFLGQDNGPGYQPKWFIDYGYTVFGPNSDFVWHVNDYNTERIFLNSDSVQPVPSGWNQLTVVTNNSAGTLSFYLNGKSIGTDSLPSYVLETNAPLIFGYAEPGLGYSGLMNNVVLYNRALTPGEVGELAAVPEPSGLSFMLAACGLLLPVPLLRRKRLGPTFLNRN